MQQHSKVLFYSKTIDDERNERKDQKRIVCIPTSSRRKSTAFPKLA